MAATQVLDEGVSGDDYLCCLVRRNTKPEIACAKPLTCSACGTASTLGQTFVGTHTHYLFSGAATVDGWDLQALITAITEHGYGSLDREEARPMSTVEHPRWCVRSRCKDLAHLGRMIEVSEDYVEIKLWLRKVKNLADAEPHMVLVSGEAVIVISLRQALACA